MRFFYVLAMFYNISAIYGWLKWVESECNGCNNWYGKSYSHTSDM